jgi:hypothetical protein
LVDAFVFVAVVMTEVLKDTGISELDELTNVACPKNGYGEVTLAVERIIAGGLKADPMMDEPETNPIEVKDAFAAPPVSCEKHATAQYWPLGSVCPAVDQFSGIFRTLWIEDMIEDMLPAPVMTID